MGTGRGRTYSIITLGCPKNTVDSAAMGAVLARAGWRSAADVGADPADVVIVNTCGFLRAAREESLSVLRDVATNRRSGQRIVATGCMAELQSAEIAARVPAVDAIVGTRRWMDIAAALGASNERAERGANRPTILVGDSGACPTDIRRCVTQGGSAYLQIADGCRRSCAFCAIPLIKGPAVSRPVEAVLDDARHLRDRGVLELVLIAQDTTDYGRDLGLADGLAVLLERLCAAVPDVPWIRILYAHPSGLTDRLIDVVASEPRVLPYLDLPLQHAAPRVLRAMHRPHDMPRVRSRIERLRDARPGFALRTTFIVGHPGETEAEFGALLDFVRDERFDRVGVFEYSCEPGTASAALLDAAPTDVSRARYDRLMTIQRGISLAKNRALVGTTMECLVEGANDGVAIGRTYRDAPEIDGLVVVDRELPIGTLAHIEVTGATAYDIEARPVTSPTEPLRE